MNRPGFIRHPPAFILIIIWAEQDSNLRRAKPARFTVWCHWPLGHLPVEIRLDQLLTNGLVQRKEYDSPLGYLIRAVFSFGRP